MTENEYRALIAKYLAGEANEREIRLVDEFIRAQESRVNVKPELSEEMWNDIASRINPIREGGAPQYRKRWSIRKGLVVSSIILFLAVSAFVVQRMSGDYRAPVEWTTATAERGQKSLITLADGSQVFLNAESSLTYPESFGEDKREVTLTGEAFFIVAKDGDRPFEVRTGEIVTQVLGTSFNVEAFQGEASKVTVVTGKVRVTSTTDSADVIVEPNQQVVFDGESDFVLRKVDVEPYVAWKDRTLYFDGNTLEEVVAELERWYNVDITLQGNDIGNCRVNGQYKDMELRSVLSSIRYMYQIEFEFRDEKDIVLHGKGCD